MYDLVIAVALITSGVDVDDELEYIQVLRPTIIAAAIDLQILDPREALYAIGPNSNYLGLKEIQTRYEKSINFPKIEEAMMLPSRKIINLNLEFNRSLRSYFVERKKIDLLNSELLDEAISQCDQLYVIWDTMRDIQCEYYYITLKRSSLDALRQLIGAEAYYSGNLPPAFPYWHMPRE